MCSYDLGNHSKEVSGIWLQFATLIIKIGGGHQLADFHKCAANSQKAQKPSLCKMAATKMALESLFLRLETFPGPLCGAETKTLQMRTSKPKLEVVTNRQIFQKPLWNQKIFQFPCIKMALAAKPWVRMTLETTQNDHQDLPPKMPPWKSKSEMVTNWRIFQKLTTTPKMAKKNSKCKKSNFSQQIFFSFNIWAP